MFMCEHTSLARVRLNVDDGYKCMPTCLFSTYSQHCFPLGFICVFNDAFLQPQDVLKAGTWPSSENMLTEMS